MKRAATLALLAAALACASCSYIPWFHSKPKYGPLPDYKEKANARIAWHVSLGEPSAAGFAPVREGDKIYAATPEGVLTSVDAGDGHVEWKINVGHDLAAGVGSDGSLLAVGTSKGDVLAFDLKGAARWHTTVSSEILSPPKLADGIVVVWSGDGRIFGLSATDGSRKWVWQQATPSLVVRNAAGGVISRSGLFTGLPGGKLLALDLATGAVGWQTNISTPKGATELERIADVTSLPAVEEHEVCAAAYQGRVGCFDVFRGTLNWTRELSSYAGIQIDNRYLYVTDDQGNVHALDKATGASVWRQDKLQTRKPGGPQLVGDYLAVVDAQGYVHFLDRNDGSLVGRLETDGSPAISLPVSSGSGIAYISKNGTLYQIVAP